MIPLWVILLLDTMGVGEFSYSSKYSIFIKGNFLNGEWVVDVRVDAMPYFAWGCNKAYTGIGGSFKSVVRYYLTVVLNQLSEYNAEDRTCIVSALKDNLE